MHEICPRYAQGMPEICQSYVQDMTTPKTVLTKRLPDKTSKPVRLKKMSHKSVLTKRLPDKTSKPVLTKFLPDKMSADHKVLVSLKGLKVGGIWLNFNKFVFVDYRRKSLMLSPTGWHKCASLQAGLIDSKGSH